MGSSTFITLFQSCACVYFSKVLCSVSRPLSILPPGSHYISVLLNILLLPFSLSVACLSSFPSCTSEARVGLPLRSVTFQHFFSEVFLALPRGHFPDALNSPYIMHTLVSLLWLHRVSPQNFRRLPQSIQLMGNTTAFIQPAELVWSVKFLLSIWGTPLMETDLGLGDMAFYKYPGTFRP